MTAIGARPQPTGSAPSSALRRYVESAATTLEREDPELGDLLTRELERQRSTLAMVAASSVAEASVLLPAGTWLGNVTTEGYPGARFHAGCEVVDDIERLAAQRARAAFGARYANVQPHSGSSANLCVLFALLEPGDTLLGLDLDQGGHLTHGSPASVVGRTFRALPYGLGADGRIDYAALEELAVAQRPRMIICGASAYPRTIDFARIRSIADRVGAWVLADISHIAGLVAAGVHPSPVDHAHVTTTSTYKQLYGPRGGLILSGRDAETPVRGRDGRETSLRRVLQRAVFPMGQGTPDLAAVAAKARALARLRAPEFVRLARRIVADAQAFADALAARGHEVLTGGTDNHLFLTDVRPLGLTGVAAERVLERCGIIVNRNRIPGDTRPALVTSGLRFGTNTLALRGMEPADMATCAALVDRVLRATRLEGDEGVADEDVVTAARREVAELCDAFPLPAGALGGAEAS